MTFQEESEALAALRAVTVFVRGQLVSARLKTPPDDRVIKILDSRLKTLRQSIVLWERQGI